MDALIRKAIARIEVVSDGPNPTVRSRGTGFLVADGIVLTALHVVANRRSDPPEPIPGCIRLTFPGMETEASIDAELFDGPVCTGDAAPRCPSSHSPLPTESGRPPVSPPTRCRPRGCSPSGAQPNVRPTGSLDWLGACLPDRPPEILRPPSSCRLQMRCKDGMLRHTIKVVCNGMR